MWVLKVNEIMRFESIILSRENSFEQFTVTWFEWLRFSESDESNSYSKQLNSMIHAQQPLPDTECEPDERRFSLLSSHPHGPSRKLGTAPAFFAPTLLLYHSSLSPENPSLLPDLIASSSASPSFQSGTFYKYDYILDLQVANVVRPSVPRTWLVTHATVETYLLWRNKAQPEEQLVHVQIKNVILQNNSKEILDKKEDTADQHIVEKDSNLMSPFLFHWSSGKVLGLYTTEDDNSHIMNLKRGLVSLFQFQPQPGFHLEEDVSGKCQVLYDVSENIFIKKKIFSSCIKRSFGYEADHKVFGVSWNSSSTASMSLNGATLQKAVCEENHNLSSNLGRFLGTHITSRQEMELVSSEHGPPEILGESVEEILGQLPNKYRKVQIQSQPVRPSTQTSLIEKYLADSKRKGTKLTVSKTSTVKHFHEVVKTFRQAKKRDILHGLQTASSDLLLFFVDAAVAAQSPSSVAALADFLDFTKKNQANLHEKFLYSAAFAPHPTPELLRLVLKKLKQKVSDPTVMETGIIITGAMIGKLCRMDLCEEKDVAMAKATLLEGLNNAEDEAEMKIYLLSLKNAQLPETIPVLLQYAEEHTGAVCSTALSVLQGFPPEVLSTEVVKDTMKSIFHQTHQAYDAKSRLIAAETLLSADCSMEDLKSVSEVLQLMDNESSTLLLSKLRKKLNLHHPLKKSGKIHSLDILQYNYWNLSHAGQSTVFSGLLTATEDISSIYNLDLLFTESGLLKRTVSDVMLFDHSHHLKTMQVSIEAQGLQSLMGDEEVEDEGEDASVGMSAVLFDVQLRPVVFFKGYMDLISKVFSSSGEPTNVVKGNVLLVDYLQWLPLQSGLQAMVQYQGGLGLEILADIDVSIWDQQAKTNINTKAGLVLEFNTEVSTSFFDVNRKVQLDAEGSFSFDSMMRVTSTPVLMCLELRHDDLPYREAYITRESFLETNATHTVRKGRKSIMWGRDFPFHHANSEMCRALKAEEDLFANL
ncbi:microsomal triglyceride transfer protein-like [Gastrophryne carolinensis]